MRNTQDTIEWYRTHETAAQIGFEPSGMCLKICRTARDIGSMFLSAKQAQDATPAEHRVHNVANLRRGMVLYFDDPNDSNKFGHIVTMIGRVKNPDRSDLNDILVRTNSVQDGRVVVVRASYFKEHWGDPFQFGATWLNGVELEIPAKRYSEVPRRDTTNRVEHFRESRPNWDVKILDRAVKAGRHDLVRHVNAIETAVHNIPNDSKNEDVREFKKAWHEDRILKLHLLSEVPNDFVRVRISRDQLRRTIKRVLN
jgi:hypothetical protein